MLISFIYGIVFVFEVSESSIPVEDEISQLIAKINENGYPESLIYEAAGFSGKTADITELSKRLENPDVQKALVQAAMKYTNEKIDGEVKRKFRSIKRQRSWSDYCSYSWLKWLTFLGCKNSEQSNINANIEEPESNFSVMKDNNKCYKKSSSDL